MCNEMEVIIASALVCSAGNANVRLQRYLLCSTTEGLCALARVCICVCFCAYVCLCARDCVCIYVCTVTNVIFIIQ